MDMFSFSRVKNGVILERHFMNHEGKNETEQMVYQEPYGGDDEFEQNSVEAFADFLRCIDEEYGPSTGRRSPKRLCVVVNPGDKFNEHLE